MTAVVIVYLLAWVPLVFAGRALGRRWDNPDAGLWLPVLLGVLGFAVFIAASYPWEKPIRTLTRP
jgi:hypothetical protein